MPDREGFPGLIHGYPEVAVDRFTGPCLNARYFLLSHLHMDHMQGLASPELLAVLAALPGPRLLLSRQSAALLSSWPRYAALQPYLCPLEVGEPRQLAARLVVTPLPAAHCPGSVMFLLEAGSGGTVLYTGDFRLSRRHLTQMKPLHDADDRPKTIDVLYADTTFCVPGRRELPDRGRSADSVTRLVTEWLDRGPSHRANLDCKARYGYESVFRRLYEATGMRVHVDEEKCRLYERLPDIARCVTPYANETRLHSCRPGAACLRGGAGGTLRVITLSTLFYFIKQEVDRLEYPLGGERYRVLYSFHASLSQVQEMVAYLRPGRVVPCVVPPGSSLEEVEALLGGAGPEQEPGPVGEPDSRRPLLLHGGGWERQPKRPLLPPGPVETGPRQHATVDDRQSYAELKRMRAEPQSPLRHQALQESPRQYQGHQVSPRQHQGHQESPRQYQGHQKSPRQYQGHQVSPRQYQGHQESPRRPQGHQESPQRPTGRPAGQVTVDTRPAWKCPFDSD